MYYIFTHIIYNTDAYLLVYIIHIGRARKNIFSGNPIQYKAMRILRRYGVYCVSGLIFL